MPTSDGPLDPWPGTLPTSRLVGLWLKPVETLLPVLQATAEKPIGQFTMREVLAWSCTIGYIMASVTLAEAMAINVLRVAIRGR
jgi:hypothetical protein